MNNLNILLESEAKKSFKKHLELENRADLLPIIDELVKIHIFEMMDFKQIEGLDLEQIKKHIDDYVEDRVWLINNES